MNLMKAFALIGVAALAFLIPAARKSEPTASQATAIRHALTLKETQHRAMYAIAMDNGKTGEDRQAAGCTADAIAPHVLLTAEHCNIDGGNFYLNPTLRDGKLLPDHPLRVSEKYFDHMDHMLLVLPGVRFKYTISYDPATYRAPRQGDRAYFWGNPAMQHDQYREGYMTGTIPAVDGDVDASGPVWMFNISVIGGDSGSAVFSTDGRLITVVTYGVANGMFMGAYPLAFTEEQVRQAEGRGTVVYGPPDPIINIIIVPPASALAPSAPQQPQQPQDNGPHHRF